MKSRIVHGPTSPFTAVPIAVAALVLCLVPSSADAKARASTKPTIAFVHGAFADASGFASVTRRLQRRGYPVIAPANPLRGPTSDGAHVAAVLEQVKGPIVLVAHSYGGAVATEAAGRVGNVKALVYLNALAMDVGESNLSVIDRFPNEFPDTLRPVQVPQADGTESTELFVDVASFRSFFAADVPASKVAVMAGAQRPLSLAGAQEKKSTAPAWKIIPSWYLVSRQDRVINPDAQRFMAKRATARTTEIDSSHASYVARPEAVTNLILRAAGAARVK